MMNNKPSNPVPTDPIWRKNRVKAMVEEMGEHGIEGKMSVGVSKKDPWWEVSLADFDDNDKMIQHVSINCCHDNGYELVQAAYMATLKGRE